MNRGLLIRTMAGLVLVAILAVPLFSRSPMVVNPRIENGETMGTLYNVVLAATLPKAQFEALVQQIEAELESVNNQMSTWRPESEISHFNQSVSTNPFAVSPGFATVIRDALALSEAAGGAFDPTLNPLLNLWGFGSAYHERKVPDAADILRVKALTGWHRLHVDAQGRLTKEIPELELDLGAIAKGYGVDRVAHIIQSAGVTNYFVEIGGEVVASGVNREGVPWRIGVQNPAGNPMDSGVLGTLHITNGAVATSGDYWNYIEQNGQIYSHILDPRSGMAIFSEVASVTVVAPTCTLADGMATALFVMGTEAGMEWVEQRPEVEALFLVRSPDGKIFEKFSSGFCGVTGYSLANCSYRNGEL